MPSSSARFGNLLGDLGTALTKLGVRWYVFGAQASILHGAARLTADVDVTIELGKLPVAPSPRKLVKHSGRHQRQCPLMGE